MAAALAAAVKDNSFYTQLRSEIENDPANLGYAPFRASGSDGNIADLLNQVRSTITISKTYIAFADLMAAMVAALGNVSAQQAAQLQLLGLNGQIKIGDTAVRAYLEGVYNNATNKAALVAQYTRKGSQAELLWGDGTVIYSDDISTARTLTGASW